MITKEDSEGSEKSRKRILLIDDEPGLTLTIRLNLESTGAYEVREENCSTNAMESIYDFMPDLILLDVMMPDLDGADVVYKIKNDPNIHNIPVVFHTATVRETELESNGGLISGFPFLAKPATFAQVLAIIEENLNKSESVGEKE
jgi:CheY-like chemotaxis protein